MTTILLVWYALGWSAAAINTTIPKNKKARLGLFTCFAIGWVLVPILAGAVIYYAAQAAYNRHTKN